MQVSRVELTELVGSVLSRGVALRFRARGFSMAPLIRDGDIVTISPLGQQAPCAGDVVACRLGANRLVVHRVRAVTPDGYRIQGDSLPRCDGVVPASDVLGRLTLAERAGQVVFRTRPNAPGAFRALNWRIPLLRNSGAALVRRLGSRLLGAARRALS